MNRPIGLDRGHKQSVDWIGRHRELTDITRELGPTAFKPLLSVQSPIWSQRTVEHSILRIGRHRRLNHRRRLPNPAAVHPRLRIRITAALQRRQEIRPPLGLSNERWNARTLYFDTTDRIILAPAEQIERMQPRRLRERRSFLDHGCHAEREPTPGSPERVAGRRFEKSPHRTRRRHEHRPGTARAARQLSQDCPHRLDPSPRTRCQLVGFDTGARFACGPAQPAVGGSTSGGGSTSVSGRRTATWRRRRRRRRAGPRGRRHPPCGA